MCFFNKTIYFFNLELKVHRDTGSSPVLSTKLQKRMIIYSYKKMLIENLPSLPVKILPRSINCIYKVRIPMRIK